MQSAAEIAGKKYVAALMAATVGYYWEIVHVKTGDVVNRGFSSGFGSDCVGVAPDKLPGFEIRTIAAYRAPFIEI